MTATSTFTLAVIRDVTQARHLADLARYAARDGHDSQELLDSIITSLYNIGLSLQAVSAGRAQCPLCQAVRSHLCHNRTRAAPQTCWGPGPARPTAPARTSRCERLPDSKQYLPANHHQAPSPACTTSTG
jgi:hypothetical protein